MLRFAPFRLDAANERLWRGPEPVALRPKSFALLRYLAERPGRLVRKHELLEAIWPDTFVTDVVLKVCMNELRRALDDDPKAPRFIETVHRRGYRFVAAVDSALDAGDRAPGADTATSAPARIVVGREREIAALTAAFREVLAGRRQTIFVAGEAGIGKTTLVDAFLDRARALAGDAGLWIARGQSIAQYGAGEPFLPLREGLGRLCRDPDGARVLERLRAVAPEWADPLRIATGDGGRSFADAPRAPSPERMLGLMAEVLEALSLERPLALVIEDLHWGDHATTELLACVAQRPEEARLLVIATYRPSDAIVRDHPLRALQQELQVRGRAREVALGFLDEAAVQAFLALRFPATAIPDGVARWLQARTDGNPLFLVRLVEDAIARGVLGRDAPLAELDRMGVPEGLRQMIDAKLDRLDAADRELLEAASVAGGAAVSAAAIAAALERDLVDVERDCAALARRAHVLRPADAAEWPDGTIAAGFAFVHSLYREQLYAGISPARRGRMHRRIALRLEAGYAGDTSEVASELAVHFTEAREPLRASAALRDVAHRALATGAPHEAATALERARALLARAAEGDDRERLALELASAQLAYLTKGFAAPDAGAAFERVRVASERLGALRELVMALSGLWSFHSFRGSFHEAEPIVERLIALADLAPRSEVAGLAHAIAGMMHCDRGDLATASAHLDRALDPALDESRSPYVDFRVVALGARAFVATLTGDPTAAERFHAEARARAREVALPFSLGLLLIQSCELAYAVEDPAGALGAANEAIELAARHGFPLWGALARVARAWARLATAMAAGTGQRASRASARAARHEMADALEAYRALGGGQMRAVFLATIAAADARIGDVEGALAVAAEAVELAERIGDRRHLAETYRRAGECWRSAAQIRDARTALAADDARANAEAAFRRAVDVARSQGAAWWELRAATSLAGLWAETGRPAQARELLAPACERFAGWERLAPVAAAQEVLRRIAP
ncbi:MAG TPA: AAA family ATPase [Candidatus Binatia bacterium]|nr:AAA family ATPase [Candidatus Binatia bacterium]